MSVQTQSRHPTVAEPGPQTPIQVHVPQLRLGTNILHLVKILKDCGPDLIVSQEDCLFTSSQLLLNYGLLEGGNAPYFFCQPRPSLPGSGRQLCIQKAPDECPFANLPLRAFITKVAEGSPKLMVGLCTISSPQSLLDLELS